MFKRLTSLMLTALMITSLIPSYAFVADSPSIYNKEFGLAFPRTTTPYYWTSVSVGNNLDVSPAFHEAFSDADSGKDYYSYYCETFYYTGTDRDPIFYLRPVRRTGANTFDDSYFSFASSTQVSCVGGDCTPTKVPYNYYISGYNSPSTESYLQINDFDLGDKVQISTSKGNFYIVHGEYRADDYAIEIVDNTDEIYPNTKTVIMEEPDDWFMLGVKFKYDDNGTPDRASWVSSNPEVATINGGSDRWASLIMKSPGTTTITASGTYSGQNRSDSVTITVEAAPNPTIDEVTDSKVGTTYAAMIDANYATEYGYSTTNDATTVDNWQNDSVIYGLNPGTYYFFVKNTTNEPAKVSEGFEYTIDSTNMNPVINDVEIDDATGDAIVDATDEEESDLEYGYSDTNDSSTVDNWQSSNEFTGLPMGDSYFFVKDSDGGISDGVLGTRENSVVSIEVEGAKTEYNIGDAFTEQGTVKITLVEGTDETPLIGSMVSGFDTTTAGPKEITVTYEGANTTYDIQVKAEKPVITGVAPAQDGLSVDVETSKAGNYEYGYNTSDDASTVTNWQDSNKFTPMEDGDYYFFVRDAADNTAVSDSFGYTASGLIYATTITVSGTTSIYDKDAAFDNKGSIHVEYTDGTNADITITPDMLTGFDTTTEGPKTVTVKVDDKGATDTFEINVVDFKEVELVIEVSDEEEWAQYKVISTSGTPAQNVDYITTPNGRVDSHMTSYLVDKNGTYNFRVDSLDGVNFDTDAVTVTKVDNEKPVIVIGFNADWNKILIDAVDNGEIDRVVLPGGDYYYKDELPLVLDVADITVGTVVAYDKAGNFTSKDFDIQHSTTTPGGSGGEGSLFFNLGNTGFASNWTNQDIPVDVFATSNGGEITDIAAGGPLGSIPASSSTFDTNADTGLSSGFSTFSIPSNGTYNYSATNELGTYSDTIVITNIDKVAPTITLNLNQSLLNIDVQDDASGLQLVAVPTLNPAFIQPDAQYVDSSMRKQLDVSTLADGEYTIVATDYAGNKTTATFTVSGGTTDPDDADINVVANVVVTLDMNRDNTGVNASNIVAQLEKGGNYTINPLGEGYISSEDKFVCWNTMADGSGDSYAEGAVLENIQADTTLYLITAERTYGVVTVHGNNSGATDVVETLEDGETFTFPTVVVSEGKDFLGFHTAATVVGGETLYQAGDTYTVAGDVDFYVITKDKEYTVTIHGNGSGYTDSTSTVTHGGTFTVPSITVSSNKNFLGLSTTSNGSATIQVGNTLTITSNTDLYVISSNKNNGGGGSGGSGGGGGGSSSTKEYDIDISKKIKNGDVDTNKDTARSGEVVTLTVTPDRGYILDEIEVTRDSNGKEIKVKSGKATNSYTFEMPSGDVTVYATFEKDDEYWDKVGNTDYQDCPQDRTCPIYVFTDANPKEWYHDGLHYCIDNGILAGYGDNIMKPNTAITRAMLVTMLWRLEGTPYVNHNMTFTDANDAWSREAIRWANYIGIVAGYNKETFGSNDKLTREQMVTILYRFAQYKGADTDYINVTYVDLDKYTDYSLVAPYAREAIKWALDSGIIQGVTTTTILPQGTATRAQVGTIFKNYIVEY